jgi:Tol biopolymer transport system component
VRHRRVGVVVGVSLLAAAVASPLPAQAAYPGRDGKIAYVLESGTRHDIWTINADGTGNRRLTFDGRSWHPRWSPDGRLIAFERSRDIYVMTATGRLVRRVTRTGRAHQPTWSPSGRRLAFVNVLPNGRGDIYTVAATGGAITRLTRDAATTCGNDRPTWSPLGTLIVYHQRTGVSCDHSRILLVTVSTRVERLVTEDGALTPSDWVANPDVAADGRHLVFMAYCETSDPSSCGGNSLNPVVSDLQGLNRRFLAFSSGAEGDEKFLEVAAAPDGHNAVVVGGGRDFQGTVMHLVPDYSLVLFVDDSVGRITQPDWQPLP